MAKRFRFRLETLLRVRQTREREVRRRLAAKRAEIARLDGLDALAEEEIARTQAALVADQQGRIDPVILQRGRVWIGHLRRAMTLRAAQRATLQAQLQQLLADLRQARTQTRVLDKLRERRWAEFRRARERQEQADADELARQLQGFDRPGER